MRCQQREKGVALVLVLSVLALVSAWAASNVREDWLSLRQAENMQLSMRAWMAAESGLELARIVLKDDAANSAIDSLEEDWAQATPAFDVDEGEIKTEIVDANRFVNLNDLVGANGAVQPEMLAIIKRLFEAFDLPSALADALADWMDADSLALGIGGGENASYLDQDYHVKNAPLDNIQELLLVIGFDAEILAKLRTVAIVRRSQGITPVNINTAPREVLMSLSPNISSSDAEAVISERDSNPYEKVADMTTQPQYAAWAASINAARLSVVSDAFVVRSAARFDRAHWGEEMLLLRDGVTLHAEYRQRLGWTE